MSLNPRVADLLQREFATIRTVRDLALQRSLAQIQAEAGMRGMSGGTPMMHATNERCSTEYLERSTEYLERTLRRLSDLREPWTEALRTDVEALLRRQLETDWEWLIGIRETQLGEQLKAHGADRVSSARTTALRRIEEELGFRVLREERRRLPVVELLTAPRYTNVLLHWEQANEYSDRSPPADREAAREAMLALEALARLAADDPAATLGSALKTLNARTDDAGRLLFSSIEKLWAFSNQAPSVRHGGGSGDPITNPEAQYVVGVTGNAIRLLLTFDLG